jgi:hypothetical protein
LNTLHGCKAALPYLLPGALAKSARLMKRWVLILGEGSPVSLPSSHQRGQVYTLGVLEKIDPGIQNGTSEIERSYKKQIGFPSSFLVLYAIARLLRKRRWTAGRSFSV